ncbi:hypothetical protein DDP54_11915 [Cellulomonas sp. WB94]|uniref:putative acetyltransferase n=1 Tax=Cellulomonas sp. WB94 TaxID=2173174 RepID=UPI000D5675AF|nr:hypothetical protein [Cellulomonas sp. WB94]PVU83581.1 hypothetical protein DDP54_11915 [Cellulomonas sp. WB94]
MNQPWRTLTPGKRVVVRRRLGPDEELLYSDVLGELLVVDDDGVLIETRRGQVHVPGHDIALAKVVPPAPARRPRRD